MKTYNYNLDHWPREDANNGAQNSCEDEKFPQKFLKFLY